LDQGGGDKNFTGSGSNNWVAQVQVFCPGEMVSGGCFTASALAAQRITTENFDQVTLGSPYPITASVIKPANKLEGASILCRTVAMQLDEPNHYVFAVAYCCAPHQPDIWAQPNVAAALNLRQQVIESGGSTRQLRASSHIGP